MTAIHSIPVTRFISNKSRDLSDRDVTKLLRDLLSDPVEHCIRVGRPTSDQQRSDPTACGDLIAVSVNAPLTLHADSETAHYGSERSSTPSTMTENTYS